MPRYRPRCPAEGRAGDAVGHDADKAGVAAFPDEGFGGSGGVGDDAGAEAVRDRDRQTPVHGREMLRRQDVVQMPDQRLARQPRRRAADDQRLLRVGVEDIIVLGQLGELERQCRDAGCRPQSLTPAAAAPDAQDSGPRLDHRGGHGVGAQEIREGTGLHEGHVQRRVPMHRGVEQRQLGPTHVRGMIDEEYGWTYLARRRPVINTL